MKKNTGQYNSSSSGNALIYTLNMTLSKMEFLNFEGEIHFEIDIWAGYLAAAFNHR